MYEHILLPDDGSPVSGKAARHGLTFAREKGAQMTTYCAKLERVRCNGITTATSHPWEGILQAAREQGCDLVFMASHGRGGMTGLLLGSETQKVLTHSKIPVLVER